MLGVQPHVTRKETGYARCAPDASWTRTLGLAKRGKARGSGLRASSIDAASALVEQRTAIGGVNHLKSSPALF